MAGRQTEFMNRITLVTVAMLSLIACGSSASETAGLKAERVVVDKSESRLYLIRDEEPFASFRVSFGGDPNGHKVREGDQKTPEGWYVLDYKVQDSQFHRSIHVSYPNPRDIENARELGVEPGGQIMIHGQPNGWRWLGPFSQFVDWTDGCIALTDNNMDKVWAAVDPGTPIHIKP
jgi:murein L,D-transpeptidase YafK